MKNNHLIFGGCINNEEITKVFGVWIGDVNCKREPETKAELLWRCFYLLFVSDETIH